MLRQLEIAQQQAIVYARELRQLYNAEREKRRQLELAHRELEEAHRRLAEWDEAKTAFVDLISHELRTPLAILRGYLELIREEIADQLNDEQRDYFNVVLEKANQLTSIVEELTTFSQLASGQAVEAPGLASFADVLADIQHSFWEVGRQTGISFRIEAPEPLPDYCGDPSLVQLILRHLLHNAFKFNHEGGEVVLEIAELPGAVQLRVRDTGEGIPPDRQQQIFESFRQAEPHLTRRHQGLGLGLNVVQRAVARLRGQVMVESELGTGTTFTVVLPHSQADLADAI